MHGRERNVCVSKLLNGVEKLLDSRSMDIPKLQFQGNFMILSQMEKVIVASSNPLMLEQAVSLTLKNLCE